VLNLSWSRHDNSTIYESLIQHVPHVRLVYISLTNINNKQASEAKQSKASKQQVNCDESMMRMTICDKEKAWSTHSMLEFRNRDGPTLHLDDSTATART